MNKDFYDSKFYNEQSLGSSQSASKVVPILIKYFKPTNVIDVGCGLGTWLEIFSRYGMEITGLDGEYVDKSAIKINKDKFLSYNLEESISLDKKYDLVISLEVIEHLTSLRGPMFVKDLTNLGDIIVFSAAIPNQGGTNHINERWLSYWQSVFAKYNYVMLDCIRPVIWNDEDIEFWYRQNMVVFCNGNCVGNYEKLLCHQVNTMVDVIHPSQYLLKAKRKVKAPLYKKILKLFKN